MSEELKNYKCPNCNGVITFDPNAQKLVCPSCGTELNVESVIAFNQLDGKQTQDHFDWDEYNFEDLEADGMHSYTCEACGGEIVGDASMASSNCPYCGNNVIVEKQFEGILKPNYILPFKLDKDTAIQKFKEHFKAKILVPSDFKSKSILKEITGLYVPYWLFDCDADAQIQYRAERSESYRSGDYIITNTDHYLLYREGDMSFKNIPVDGTNKIEAKVLEALEPFNFEDLKPFNVAYLQGYLSDRFKSDAQSAKPRANERVRQSMVQELNSTTAGYTMIVPTSSSINLKSGRIAYALLPVWMLHAEYKGKKYTFAMNGSTGKFVGDLPISYKRFMIILALILIICTIVISLILIGLFGI